MPLKVTVLVRAVKRLLPPTQLPASVMLQEALEQPAVEASSVPAVSVKLPESESPEPAKVNIWPLLFTVTLLSVVPELVVAKLEPVLPANVSMPVCVNVPLVCLKPPFTVRSVEVAQLPLPVKEIF